MVCSWSVFPEDGLVVKTCVSGAADLSLILSRAIPMTFKLVITASMLDAMP